MLNLPNSNILLCVEPTDMRKSFDSLAMLVRGHLGGDPLSVSWFLFHGKKNDRLKILYWDRDGYALWYKRLEAGAFQFPNVSRNGTRGAAGIHFVPLGLGAYRDADHGLTPIATAYLPTGAAY